MDGKELREDLEVVGSSEFKIVLRCKRETVVLNVTFRIYIMFK